MTPLLNKLYIDSNKKEKDRSFIVNTGDYTDRIDNLDCVFDCSKIFQAAVDIGGDIESGSLDISERIRLPGRLVWMEFLWGTERVGFLLHSPFAKRNQGGMDVFAHDKGKGVGLSGIWGVSGNTVNISLLEYNRNLQNSLNSVPMTILSALFYLINTPRHTRIVHRSSHDRIYRKSKSNNWPLDAWKELRLVVDNHESNATCSHDYHGQRPHHHVRGHYRLIFNKAANDHKLIWIDGYWRGNKELGTIKTKHDCVTKNKAKQKEGQLWANQAQH